MRYLLAGLAVVTLHVFAAPSSAQPMASGSAAAAVDCGGASCGPPRFASVPTYSEQIPRDGQFEAHVSIDQPCGCQRQIGLLITFTEKGATKSRERVTKLNVGPGHFDTTLTLTRAQLAKARVKPGHYTVGFGLYDEHGRLAPADGRKLSGLPFTFGTSHEQLARKPALPRAIGRDAVLTVGFKFSNSGDIPSEATALLVFTRPGQTRGIEFYQPKLRVRPGGTLHRVRLTAAKRRELKIGAGAWLVTASGFDGQGQRLESYPGNLLTIGKLLSQPAAPKLTSPIAADDDLRITLTLANASDYPEVATALLTFSRAGLPKPIEYRVEGLTVPVGASTHDIVLTATDRYNLGIRPGRFRVSVSALDRAGKRVRARRANALLIEAKAAQTASK